ncbi:MAG: hypothetical protein AB7F40_00470 [Victivallaceae bacterium]|nr:hypothetical protein [Victivallaceae bacterium]
MRISNMLKWLVAGGGLIIPALELPYYFNALIHSPLDRWSWVFVAISLVMMASVAARLAETSGKFALAAMLPALGFGAIFIFAIIRQIHAAAMIAGCGFAWSAAYFAFGWTAAYTLAPAYGMLALGATSVRYRLGAAVGIDGLMLQAFIASALIAWQIVILNARHRPKASDFIFAILAAVIAAGAFMGGRLQMQRAFAPDFSACVFGQYRGMDIMPNQSDRMFFGSSKVERYRFPEDRILPDGRVVAIEVLKVGNFEDVHKIHPPGHCLTVSGNTVLSENVRSETILGTPFDINEIVTSDSAGMKSLVWVWYSTPTVSSGNFDALRYGYDPAAGWHEYLLWTPLSGDDPGPGRTILRDFLSEVAASNRQTVDNL